MFLPIPKPVQTADEALFALLQRIAFSRYLNPTNGVEARQAFRRGDGPPRFQYEPLTQADALLRELDAVDPPTDHPAGALIGQCIEGTRRLIRALRDRTAEAFHTMNEGANWYPTPEILRLSFPPSPRSQEPMDVGAEALIEWFRMALIERDMTAWKVEEDPVMSARVLVDSAKRIIRVRTNARFRQRDLARLVVHELDVHARRSVNGRKQVLRCFATGLPGSLTTEEGLAMIAEEESGTASPGVLGHQLEVHRAIDHARTTGFREVYKRIEERAGAGLAWGISLRIKRGLADPEAPGVYAKDSVYLTGRTRIRAWLDDGGDISHLYVGKVGVDDPVAEWLEQGWVTPQPVPALWTSAERNNSLG